MIGTVFVEQILCLASINLSADSEAEAAAHTTANTQSHSPGELLEAVIKRGAYSEGEARACFAQLLRGIAYLHSR